MTSDFKCVVVGDPTVGKSSLILTDAHGKFPAEYMPAFFDNCEHTTTIDGKTWITSIWDTAAQEDYDRLRPLSYPSTDVFLICYDISSYKTFEDVKWKWMPEVRLHCPKTPLILCGTKVDLRKEYDDGQTGDDKRQVTAEEGLDMARNIDAVEFIECSAKSEDHYNVKEVFDLATKIALAAKNGVKMSKIITGGGKKKTGECDIQ